MIYFDSAYIAKCYLNEPGAEVVRGLAKTVLGLASCEWARLEFSSALQRSVRDSGVTAQQARQIRAQFKEDQKNQVWTWFPVTSELLSETAESLHRLPKEVMIRSGDALHLTCARSQGFKEIYTNDRHMLACAGHFGLKGVDLIGSGS